MPLSEQQALSLPMHSGRCLQSFIVGANDEAIAIAKAIALRTQPPRVAWLHGPANCGKSHLLEALCTTAQADGRRAAYIGLSAIPTAAPLKLDGYTAFDLVCLDDVAVRLSHPEWEAVLFSLYNELEAAGRALVMTAQMPVGGLRCVLPDLASRLSASVQLRLRPLDQAGLQLLLQQRGRALGLHLSVEVQQWLLRRIQRDVPTLLGILDYLDRVSLSAQRRLTIPFIREVLRRYPNRPFYT